jgi:hypothetical protein
LSTATTQFAKVLFYPKSNERGIFMTYRIIATHNPQDFFEGIEPEDLPEYYEATGENLTEIVSKCVNGGYTVIIYKKEK